MSTPLCKINDLSFLRMISVRLRFGFPLIKFISFYVDIFYPTGEPILPHRLPRSLFDVLRYAFTSRVAAATHGILDS